MHNQYHSKYKQEAAPADTFPGNTLIHVTEAQCAYPSVAGAHVPVVVVVVVVVVVDVLKWTSSRTPLQT